MILFQDYKSHLLRNGRNLSEVRKNQSDMVMNASFTGDVGYKKVYILTQKNGWQYVDAKYSKHATPSILRDAVDYYLQFRPDVHFPVGSYVFIPDDTSFDLDINESDPLNGDISNLWLIVGRNNSKQFVRYQVLKINWNFKWVHRVGDKIKVLNCLGCARNANSYTSGIWNDQFVTALDNITAAWLPNTAYVYGNKMEEYGLCDIRTITIQTRIMISLNDINPNCYMVSKILDMAPQGVLKLTLKQDDYNKRRDNPDIMVCDYYTDSGDITVTEPEPVVSPDKTSTITQVSVTSAGITPVSEPLVVGSTSYFMVEFSDDGIDAQWRISLNGDDTNAAAIERLMVINQLNDTLISIKPGKSNKVKGRSFTLSVSDPKGDYYSSITVEVAG